MQLSTMSKTFVGLFFFFTVFVFLSLSLHSFEIIFSLRFDLIIKMHFINRWLLNVLPVYCQQFVEGCFTLSACLMETTCLTVMFTVVYII